MQPSPTVHHVTTAPAVGSTRHLYNQNQCFGLGVTQIVLGGLCFILEIVFLSVYKFSGFQGIWAGLFIIATGVVGVCASRKDGEPRSLYTATAIMSIFASILAFIGMCIGYSTGWNVLWLWFVGVLEIIQGTLFLAAFIVAIVHSCICFKPVCCTGSTGTTTTTTVISTTPGQQVGYVNTGMYPGQPIQPVMTAQQNPNMPSGYAPPGQQAGYGYVQSGQQAGYGYDQPVAAQPIAPPPYAAAPPNNKV